MDIVKRARDEAEPKREDDEPIPPAANYQNLSESEKLIGDKVRDELLN